MTKPYIDAKKIPRHQREQLAAPLLTIVRAAFEDPKTQKEFEEWKTKKTQKGGTKK